MKITAVGVLYSISLLYFFLRYWFKPTKAISRLWGLTIFGFLFLDLGWFMKIGTYELDYYFLGYGFLFLYLITHIRNLNMKSKAFEITLGIIILLFLGLLFRSISSEVILTIDHSIISDSLWSGSSLVAISVNSYTYIVLIKSIIFFLCIGMSASEIKKLDIKAINDILSIGAIAFICLGLFEFLLNNSVNPTLFRNLIFKLFGENDTAVKIPYYRAGLYSLLITCKEPSYVSQTLFYCSIILAFSYSITKKKNYVSWVILSVVTSLITLTVSAVFLSVILLIILFYCSYGKIRKRITIASIFALIIGFVTVSIKPDILSYYLGRTSGISDLFSLFLISPTNPLIFSTTGGSLVFRLYAMLNVGLVWIKHPLFGIGIGTATSDCGLITILSNVGIVGLILILIQWSLVSKQITGIKTKKGSILLVLLSQLFIGGITDFTFTPLLLMTLVLINFMKQKDHVYVLVSNQANKFVIHYCSLKERICFLDELDNISLMAYVSKT